MPLLQLVILFIFNWKYLPLDLVNFSHKLNYTCQIYLLLFLPHLTHAPYARRPSNPHMTSVALIKPLRGSHPGDAPLRPVLCALILLGNQFSGVNRGHLP